MGLLSLVLAMAPALALHVNRLPAASAAEFNAGPAWVRGPDVASPLDVLVDLVSPPTTRPPTKPAPPPPPTTTTTTTTTVAPSPPPPAPSGSAAPANSASGRASWYDGRKRECAHRTIPLGTVVRVTNLGNGRQTRCTVTNRGPYKPRRIVDVTKATFADLAPPSQGVINVRVEW